MKGVDVLAQQGHLAHALRGQGADFRHDLVDRAGPLGTARIRHNAESAELVATFLDRHEGRIAVDLAVIAQLVELVLDLELGIQRLAAGAVGLGDQFGEFVIGLRTDDEIDDRCTFHDFRAFGLGDATGHGNGHAARRRLFFLQRAQATQLGIDFLGRLFADVTGIENDQVGAIGLIGRLIAQRRQNIPHPFGVVDIHLAAIGLDKQAFARRTHETFRARSGPSLQPHPNRVREAGRYDGNGAFAQGPQD